MGGEVRCWLWGAAVECEITECQPLADGRFYLELKGLRRFRVGQQTEVDGYRVAVPEVPPPPPPPSPAPSPSSLEIGCLAPSCAQSGFWRGSLREEDGCPRPLNACHVPSVRIVVTASKGQTTMHMAWTTGAAKSTIQSIHESSRVAYQNSSLPSVIPSCRYKEGVPCTLQFLEDEAVAEGGPEAEALRRVEGDVEARADAWVHRIQCASPLPPFRPSSAS